MGDSLRLVWPHTTCFPDGSLDNLSVPEVIAGEVLADRSAALAELESVAAAREQAAAER